MPDPILITRPAELEALAARLASHPVVAVDTESNSLFAYREQVCLIQFSIPEQDYLVDPLAIQDLSPLGPIFERPDILKVFHAAEYDLICLKRDFSFEFNNLFDTMVAARILGREAFGLGSILEAEFGVQLDKRYQRANWGQRPLPPELLAYARLDTHYLIRLRERLEADLQRRNLTDLAQEDFQRMTHIVGNGRVHDERPNDCWRISGAYDLTPHQMAVLQELCAYRDTVARSLNRPLFKVLNDHTLLEIALAAPKNIRELSRIPGMTRGQLDRHGERLLDAVRRGVQAQPVQRPRAPRPDEQFLERLEALRRWRKNAAESMGVKSDVVLPRDLLYALAEHNPRQESDLAEMMKDVPWRLRQFGSDILRVLAHMSG